MNWTKTPPTEPGKYYWKLNEKSCWQPKTVFEDLTVYSDDMFDDKIVHVITCGGLWGGRVPAPGTTFTIPEIGAWACEHNPDQINDPQEGLVATTARHRKLWG